MSVFRNPRPLALAAAWLATRALMLWLLAHDHLAPLGGGGVSSEVGHLYFRWYGVLSQGAFPVGDRLWQYPPGAGPVLLAPALLPWLTYFTAFVTLTLAADAVIAVVLTRAGRRAGRSLRGARLWVLGLPLLLHIPLARYDVQVTAFAVVSLLTLSRRPRVGGAFAAMGALVKVWPALALIGAPRGRTTRQVWTSAAVTASALLAVLAAVFDGPFDFLRQQSGRGVQIESLGGTVLGFARRAGWPGTVRYQYGAMEFVGPYVGVVAACSLALTVAAFGLVLLWRVRARRWTTATPYDAALTAVLLFTVTSRVISPQYMVWLLGLAAVCLTSRHTTQRPVAALIVAATAVSSVVYPGFYGEVVRSTWTGCLLMLVRNGLLATAAGVSLLRLWRSGLSTAAADRTTSAGAGTRSTPNSRRAPNKTVTAS
ncbi:glycosyltransferase 87 family protein [Streptomyces sp. NPDC054766]|uniref:glycosyltransferase 87 family protein n=1 Tax=Streptomyces rhizosphaerihabitans TaxID=1266770 RepID=UPI0021C0E10D|nr:glycosyltransferase 87 family protein [Streptomyces rhizosphaerihabitans]MCT9011157.1 glycosyltransferase 87 family protein [Streptomyces rhizosphaerihabitans]